MRKQICVVGTTTNCRRRASQATALSVALHELDNTNFYWSVRTGFPTLLLSLWTAKHNDHSFRSFSPDPKIPRTHFFMMITLRVVAIGKLGAGNRNPITVNPEIPQACENQQVELGCCLLMSPKTPWVEMIPV